MSEQLLLILKTHMVSYLAINILTTTVNDEASSWFLNKREKHYFAFSLTLSPKFEKMTSTLVKKTKNITLKSLVKFPKVVRNWK